MTRLSVLVIFSVSALLNITFAIASEDDISMTIKPCSHLSSGQSLGIVSGDDGLILGDNGAGIYENHGIFTSPVTKPPVPYSALFCSYKANIPERTGLRLYIRAFINGKPTRWYRMGIESEISFETNADELQYRVVLFSDDPSKTPSLDEIVLVFEQAVPIRQMGLPEVPNPVSPSVETECPPIIEREQWGARPPTASYSHQDVEYLIVHHTAVPAAVDYQGAATIRGIQSWHIDGRHWIDLGYHFIIGPEGAIYRGRPVDAVGAHCIPNTGKVGVSVVGNFEEETLSDAARQSLVKLLAYLASHHSLATDRIRGHKDFWSTSCPGQHLYEQLDSLREDVGKLIHPVNR